MELGATQRIRGPWDRPEPRHYIVALIALLLSALLHIPLFKLEARVSRRAEMQQYLQRTMEHEVFTVPPPPALPPPAREPPRMRAEDPGQVSTTYGAADAKVLDQLPLPLPEPPEVPAGPMRGDQAPMSGPSAAPALARWEPRQEVVKVQEPIYAETISWLPRTYMEKVDRGEMAPDFTLSAFPSEIASGAAGDGSTGLAGRVVAGVSVPRYLGRAFAGGAPSAADLNPGAPPSVIEPPATDLHPAEKYLALDVQCYRPQDEPGITYFEVSISRKGEEMLPVMPKDFLVLQDCSGSIDPWRLREFKAGLRRLLPRLSPADRFEVIAFRDVQRPCFSAWVPATPANVERALTFIDGLVSQGNTDVYASLATAARMARDRNRPLVILLVTDGRPTMGTMDSSAIIEQFTRANAAMRSVFTYGAGRKVNRFLMDFVSYRNRGDSLVMPETDNIPFEMEKWSTGISRPVLSDLACHFAGIPDAEVFPASLTDLFLDRPLRIHGRADSKNLQTAFQVVGRSGDTRHDFVFRLDLANARPGDAGVRSRWVWHRIYELIGHYTATGQVALLDQVRALASRYHLDVPYLEQLAPQPAAP